MPVRAPFRVERGNGHDRCGNGWAHRSGRQPAGAAKGMVIGHGTTIPPVLVILGVLALTGVDPDDVAPPQGEGDPAAHGSAYAGDDPLRSLMIPVATAA
ncbi:MAG: hypothetical protein ACM3ML_07680 [Micromonosporaceae bacterium]